ncbi:MAG: PAS domain-containing protein, partial [Chloroflexota bacterium]
MAARGIRDDPVYRRLAARDSRRAFRLAGLVSVVVIAGAAIAEAAVGSPPARVGLMLAEGFAFATLWWLLGRARHDRVAVLGGIMGVLAVAGPAGFMVVATHPAPDVAVVLTAIIPVVFAVVASWPLRAHLVWLAGGAAIVLGVFLAGAGVPAIEEEGGAMVIAWFFGGVLSVLVHQVLERGRVDALLAIKAAHRGRAAGVRTLHRLRAVETMGRALSEHGPTPETLEAAMLLMEEEFGYRYPSIYLGNDQVMQLGAHRNYESAIHEFRRGRGVIGRVMRNHVAELIPDVDREPEFVRASIHVRSEICVPLLAADRFRGVINIESEHALGADDLATISIVADRFAAALALADRLAELHQVHDANPLPIVMFEGDERISFWNRAAEEAFGWTAAEVVGGLTPLVGPEDEVASALWARLLAGERVMSAEVARRHRDGHPVPVRMFGSRFGEREPHRFVVVYQDLRAELAASAALSESETRFETVVGALREGVLLQGPDGR